jgi:predicted NodU family carbamoyl transferase
VITLGLSLNAKIISACLFIEEEFIALESEQNDKLASATVKLPITSIKRCLQIGGINFKQIDKIVISDLFNQDFKYSYDFLLSIKSPLLKRKAHNVLLNHHQRNVIDKKLKNTFLEACYLPKYRITYSSPSECINYYTFCASGFDSAAFFNVSNNINYFTQELGIINEDKIKVIEKQSITQSLSYFYRVFTYYMGFDNLEEKFLHISKETDPIYQDKIFELLIKVGKAKYLLNPKYFNINPENMVAEYIGDHDINTFINNQNFETLFGSKRIKQTIISSEDVSLIASFVKVYKQVIYELLEYLQNETSSNELCMNTNFYGLIDERQIIDNTSFERVYIGNYKEMQEDIAMGAAMLYL